MAAPDMWIKLLKEFGVCERERVCVCVCVRERERERDVDQVA